MHVQNKLIETYIKCIENKYLEKEDKYKEQYETFIANKREMTKEEEKILLKEYPDIPQSLIDLLKYTNGTYEDYIYFLSSDVDNGKYPYYLLSANQIIETKNDPITYLADLINREYDDVIVDERIINNYKNVHWLHFADCMNNGGTSQLFIDFTPSEKGKKGQIIRFLHDPDELLVIADNFDEYIKKIIDSDFPFINSCREYDVEIENKMKSKKNNDKSMFKKLLFGIVIIILIITGMFFLL